MSLIIFVYDIGQTRILKPPGLRVVKYQVLCIVAQASLPEKEANTDDINCKQGA